MTQELAVSFPDVHVEYEKSLTLLDQSRLLVVTNKAECDMAVEFGCGLKSLEKMIVDNYKKSKKMADDLHKQICSDEKRHLTPVREALAITDKVVTAWKVAEKLKADKIAAEARAKADAEAEQRQKEELKKREDERLKQAADLAASGKKDAADALLEAPIYVPVMPTVAPVVDAQTKTDGSSLRGTWDVEAFDLMATLTAIVEGHAPLACVQYDMVYLRQRARSDKSELRIAGVRAFQKQSSTFKAKE